MLMCLSYTRRGKWGGGPAQADAGGHIELWRSGAPEESNPLVVLFDNSYSWLTPKTIR